MPRKPITSSIPPSCETITLTLTRAEFAALVCLLVADLDDWLPLGWTQEGDDSLTAKVRALHAERWGAA